MRSMSAHAPCRRSCAAAKAPAGPAPTIAMRVRLIPATFRSAKNSALSSMESRSFSGTSKPGWMASTGQASTHASQSMHSSGSM